MRKISTRLTIALCATAAVGLPAVALAGAPTARPAATDLARAARAHIVVLKNFSFHPAAISIDRGESVTWEWRDGGIKHNVTASGFRSRTQPSGSFTVRFNHAGTFAYRCTLHAAEGMKGKVVVR